MSLWPAEDDLAETGNAIAKGHMQEVMSFAKKIANSNITVFITGESGTGKEIVARAIHQFSERAGKPFVPFNCTAVPARCSKVNCSAIAGDRLRVRTATTLA